MLVCYSFVCTLRWNFRTNISCKEDFLLHYVFLLMLVLTILCVRVTLEIEILLYFFICLCIALSVYSIYSLYTLYILFIGPLQYAYSTHKYGIRANVRVSYNCCRLLASTRLFCRCPERTDLCSQRWPPFPAPSCAPGSRSAREQPSHRRSSSGS